MIRARSLAEFKPDRPSLLTIGSFDGVHLGHQALIRSLVASAHARDYGAAVVTFFPHPSVILRGRKRSLYINSPEEKAALFEDLGIDLLVTHPFNHDVAQLTAGQFVDQLMTTLNLKEVWCGADFAFGHNREGTVDWLKRRGHERGFTVQVVEPLSLAGDIISSSRIRRALADGDVAQAAACLGRPFQLPGHVVEGSRRGRTIGIPTANLEIWNERAFPGRGVYACRAWLNDQAVGAVTNIGVRPTFESDSARTVEAHLLDFSADLYGQTLRLDFITRLRPEQKFSGASELIEQIKKDIAAARDILQQPGVRIQTPEASPRSDS